MAALTHDNRGRHPDVTDELETVLRGRPRSYNDRSHSQLLGDINALYDKFCVMVRARDQLETELGEVRGQLNTMRWVVGALSAVVSAEGLIILWFATQLFNRIPR